jgi:hypothetical protein
VSVERREYELVVCSDCGQQAESDNATHFAACDCNAPLEAVTILAEWDIDPTKYGVGRRGLLLLPAAHLVPPPGGGGG